MDYEEDFLDPYEELEMKYADDIEMLREIEEDNSRPPNIPKKSLNFDKMIVTTNLPSTSTAPEVTEIRNSSSEISELPLMELDKSPNCIQNNIRFSYSQEPSCSYSKKRTVNELFGEIDDIDSDNEPNSSLHTKRSRIEKTEKLVEVVDKDAIMIARILEARKKAQCNEKDSEKFNSEENLMKQKSEVTLTRRVPKWAFVTLRNGKNEKFYAKFHSDDALNNKITTISEQCKTFRLLSIPFEDIMAEANAIVDKKFSIEEKNRNTEKTETHLPKSEETELWVQKYKPATYIDLLSDESTNRTFLKWIKLWDKVVFGREPKIQKRNKLQNVVRTKYFERNFSELDEELDELGRPKFKLALLCGPPGLGKTTLAHLIAKYAGYNVVEMNASDDRSPDIFKQQLEAATQMKAVIGKNPKPNCLVIDEIDGAPSASIDVLVKFAKDEMKSKSKKNVSKTSALKRPIICICNDVYVPALRSLRQMAFVIRFPPTPLIRLAQRLVEISHAENVKTDTGAMLALCEKANNDIRTCLSTVYCLKDQPIRITTIRDTDVGNKDMQKGLFSVWQEIFQIQNKITHSNTGTKLIVNNKSERELFLNTRMHSVLKSVQGNGDYDRLTQGVYENFLNVKIGDSFMKYVSKGLSWFCFMDEIKTNILNTQTYTLMAYMPYCFVLWSYLFSNYQKTQLKYPSLMFEMHSRQVKYSQIVQEVLKGMEPKIRAYYHQEQLLLDTLPFFTYLLNPVFRGVSIQLFSNLEKDSLQQLVNTMIDYNLNFVQERTQNGNYEFCLDPNIEDVVEFPDMPTTKTLTYSLKMIISREIELEKVRRLENALSKFGMNGDTSTPLVRTQNKSAEQYDTAENTSVNKLAQPAVHNHSQKLTPKVIKNSSTCSFAKDFFGRKVEKLSPKGGPVEINNILKSDIWFHFKEGFSNAVRRTVYMKDL